MKYFFFAVMLSVFSSCATYYTLKPNADETGTLENQPSVFFKSQSCNVEVAYAGRKIDERQYVWVKITNLTKQSIIFQESDFSLSGPTMVSPPAAAMIKSALIQKLQERQQALGARLTDKSWAGIDTILEAEEELNRSDSETKKLKAETNADQRDRSNAKKEAASYFKLEKEIEKNHITGVSLAPKATFTKWIVFDAQFKATGPVKLRINHSACSAELPLLALKSKGV